MISEEDRVTQVRMEVTRRISILGRQGRPREAVQELAALARLGVQPDTQAVTALLNACAKNGNMDMAQRVFNEMFGEFLQPDVISFCVMIKGFGDQDPPRWTAISDLLKTMGTTYKLTPSVDLYNVLLEICVRTKDEERGSELITRMLAAKIEPNDKTFKTVQSRRVLRSALRRSLNDN